MCREGEGETWGGGEEEKRREEERQTDIESTAKTNSYKQGGTEKKEKGRERERRQSQSVSERQTDRQTEKKGLKQIMHIFGKDSRQ